MLPLETLGAFFVTAIVMGLAPGPDNIFVLTQSALYGFLSVAAPPGHGWSKVHFPDTGPCIGGV